ncbi:nuclear autoantigen Sp-100-like [Chionomys nivalis]|uniref:nuclear autoantigen Sp-100-like n=1 Tax=Chionomys nivalis TaxID=269649 RepID=UPI00259984F0|nr:nuclear autoantigen Sp-100-like [Chionomys nivalis]
MDQSSPSEAPGTSWEMEGSSFNNRSNCPGDNALRELGPHTSIANQENSPETYLQAIQRMSTEDEDTETIPLEPIFLCFKKNKVMISNAIKKPFPFLEVLRDNNLITEKMYTDFKDSCTNLVPVQNVVYRALEELEKKFDPNVLWVLFSPENLSKYPDLEPISKDFENALAQNQLCFEENDRGDPNLQLSLEQGPAQESLIWSPSGPSSSDGPRHPILNIEVFRRPELPVTCGTAKGTLYVEKFVQGIYEKSIQTENGEWLTLREFEIRGNRERSKNWRQSIHCEGWNLGCLIKGKILPDSPRTKGQRENRRSPELPALSCGPQLRVWKPVRRPRIRAHPPVTLAGVERQKVAASATEVLRDNNVISNKQYEDFQESHGNLIPLRKVVYRVLEELEKKHDLKALGLLFCKQNMEAYPDLEHIFERFKNVLPQNQLWSEEIDRRYPNSQLSVEQGPGDSCSQESLTWSPSGPSSSDGWRSTQGTQTENCQFSNPQIPSVVSLSENGLSEDLYEIVDVKEDTTGDNIDGLQRPQAARPPGPGSEPEESCELKVQLSDRDAGLEPHIPLPCSNERKAIPSLGIHTSPSSVPMENIKQENSSYFLEDEQQTHARTDHNQASEIIDLTRDNSDDGPRCSEESTSVTCQSTYTRRCINSSSRRHRKRGPRILKQNNVDFNLPELPVTCGTAKGTLYKEKFKKGINEKSIRSETGRWLTPKEFEIKGGRQDSKNWRQSLRCCGWTLGELIKKELLPNPPKKKRKLENSRHCMVCGGRRKLCSCVSCGRFYHKNCHIPPVEDKSGPWSCIICKIKDQAKCQENQACHKESEVLKRKMLPEEQLKCELLLLTVYCHSKSVFFKLKPKQRKEDFPALQEHMWLDKIKNKLNKKAYHLVQHFVADMRLIFHNHSIFYKNHRFSNLGVKVESLFEETFKRTFSIQGTSK